MEIIYKRESDEKRRGKGEKGQENPSSFDMESLKIEPLEPIEPIQTIDVLKAAKGHTSLLEDGKPDPSHLQEKENTEESKEVSEEDAKQVSESEVQSKIPTDPDEINKLLSRYMSGIATEEEERQAVAYITSSKENMIAFDIMCKAVEFQDFVEEQQLEEMRQEQRKVFQRRFLWVASSIAAAVLVCLVVFSILRAGMQGSGGENFVAENENGTTVVQGQQENEAHEVENSEQEKVSVDEHSGDDVKEQNQPPLWQVNDDKNYAEGSAEEGYFNIPKHLYEVAQNETAVVFSWESDAVAQTFQLVDKDRNVLLTEEVDESCYLKLDVGKYRSYGSLTWKLNLKYKDGTERQESGTVRFK